MIILITGTIMQKEYGLKSIQENYFNSLLIINNYIIFPGGKLILFFIFFSLILKSFMDGIKKIGTFIIHIGILLFLLFTFLFLKPNDEKYIIIKENESSNLILNNNLYDLTFISNKKNNNLNIHSKNLKNINKLNIFPFKIIIKNNFENTNIKINNNFDNNFFNFSEIKYFVENEYNKKSVELILIHDKNKINKYYLIENLKNETHILFNSYKLNIQLKKSTETLPFNIFLKEFKKKIYKGTTIAKSFESDILIKDTDIEWKYNIKMNSPLRYKNYIFYQSSFIEDEKNSTILYVVNNSKINYIYISCIIILIGFIIHLNTKNRKNYE
ncbi:MAG TPA: cytochrome c biogenesis protein ResB [Candidatus Azoamicus sp.]